MTLADGRPILSTATLALEHLYNRIVARTAERDASTACVFGWREAPKQTNQGSGEANRVVLQPGDPNGKVGELTGAKLPGRNPPPIATLIEIATLFMWGYDGTDPTSDLLQYRAARRLHDIVIPIVIRTFRGHWKQVSSTWMKPETEQRFGAELQVVIAVEAMIPDDVVPEAAGGTVTNVQPTIAANGGTPVAC